ncbi:hypothetical protein ACQPZX_08335 [Actinoplanes sp. CA-142083]|uniref:hypothetical protein n=1 Tax=Actinoplanes sp. CA-142083 TaxID=3239903 RepID=UPI003D8A3A01
MRAELKFREANMSSDQNFDPMQRITQQVADCFSASGYAFVEDDKLEALAAVLTSFLTDAGVPVNGRYNAEGLRPTPISPDRANLSGEARNAYRR